MVYLRGDYIWHTALALDDWALCWEWVDYGDTTCMIFQDFTVIKTLGARTSEHFFQF